MAKTFHVNAFIKCFFLFAFDIFNNLMERKYIKILIFNLLMCFALKNVFLLLNEKH